MSIFIILCQFFILTVFYMEYGFAVDDQDLIGQINRIKIFVLNSKLEDSEMFQYMMSNTGVCYESPTDGNKVLAVAYPVCKMEIFRIPDSLGGAEYCQFTFTNTNYVEQNLVQFWDIDIKMFVFYHERVVKLVLRHEAFTHIIVLEFDNIALAQSFWDWAQNNDTPGKDEKLLDITVNKFETYLSNEGRSASEIMVKVSKNIVSDDLVSYAFWVESNIGNIGGKKILLICSSNRFTRSTIKSFNGRKIIILQTLDTLKPYYFVLHFDQLYDVNQFFIDTDVHIGNNPPIPEHIVNSLGLVVDD